jgi:hypothetical protein
VCFFLAKAESAQRAKRLRMSFSNARIHDGSIPSPVGMTKDDTGRHAALDDELPAVHGTVVRGTEDDEGVRVVIATLGAKPNVVEVHEHRARAAWNHAPAAVAAHHLASHRRRHVLSRPRRWRHHGRQSFNAPQTPHVSPRVFLCVATHVSIRLLCRIRRAIHREFRSQRDVFKQPGAPRRSAGPPCPDKKRAKPVQQNRRKLHPQKQVRR